MKKKTISAGFYRACDIDIAILSVRLSVSPSVRDIPVSDETA